MSKIQAAITGVHGWVPEYRLTNAILETMVDTNDAWITSREYFSVMEWLRSNTLFHIMRGDLRIENLIN